MGQNSTIKIISKPPIIRSPPKSFKRYPQYSLPIRLFLNYILLTYSPSPSSTTNAPTMKKIIQLSKTSMILLPPFSLSPNPILHQD